MSHIASSQTETHSTNSATNSTKDEPPFHTRFAQYLDLTLPVKSGTDSDLTRFRNVTEFWTHELGSTHKQLESALQGWYKDGAKYWERSDIGADIDGVLGGIGFVHDDDINESQELIQTAHGIMTSWHMNSAAEVGAGIGRVTEYLLSKHFSSITIMEQSARLLDKAREKLGQQFNGASITYDCQGLQDWDPPQNLDCVWMQWILGYLIDADLVQLLRKCFLKMSDNGIIFIKENVTSGKIAFWMDNEDRSIIRSPEYFRAIFREAGFKIVIDQAPKKWPQELFPIRNFVLCKANSKD